MKYDKTIVEALVSGAGVDEARQWLDTGEGDPASWNAVLAASTIEAAVQLKLAERLQSLDRAPKLLRKAARRGLHRLKSQGVHVAQDAPKAFSLTREQIQVPPVAFIGPPDMEGYSDFFLAYTDEEGTCCLMGRFGGHEGVRSLSHGHVSRSGVRKMKAEMAESLVEVPFSEALHHILPAVDTFAALRGGPPHDWTHFSTHVPAALFDAARQDPLPEAEDADVAGSSALPADIWFAFWPVADEAISKVVQAFAQRVEAGEDGDLAPLLEDAAGMALSDSLRAEWLRRSRLAATASRCRGEEHLSKAALSLAKALKDGVSGQDIPLVISTLQANVAMLAAQAQSQPGDST